MVRPGGHLVLGGDRVRCRRAGARTFPDLTSHQVINRLISTARAPARGVDNQIGHGIVDPVAALTYDVPPGDAVPPARLSTPLVQPAATAGSRHDPGVGGAWWDRRGGVALGGGGRIGGHGAIKGAVMKPMFPVGLALREARVITAFVTAVAMLWAGTFLHGPWVVWVFAVAATLLVILDH